MIDLFIIPGIVGLLLISGGVLLKNRKEQDLLFIVGGLNLLLYSFSLKNYVFVILQLVFILVSSYHYYKAVRKK